ncbi:MAG: tetratricopeptide repeat protein [Candidatus Accumulibacter sp.]|jgi:tetratricopeptide (TPR) repeat protein|uniref:tetratricopeptide repeat protein n=1 Tax=Accumulibacter sp. TaxID=2053492 RepID=UPI002589A652|nr:tetratricopeptide repeat protein [Accumulibacter sp.]MBK8117735.1 tetratricopeptide repeat protein [Accumulibacter sp.]
MLEQKLPIANSRLEVAPAQVRIILAEEGNDVLSAIMHPLEELREISMLTAGNFSIKQVSEHNHARLCDRIRHDLTRLLEKEGRFTASPTFHSHVADLHEMLGEIEAAQSRLAVAVDLSLNPSLRHRMGANFIAMGRQDKALALFGGMDLCTDVHANLRLAYLSARDNQIDDAIVAVERALNISPTDFGGRLFRGALALAKQEFPKAILNFKLALEERQSVSAYTNLAISYVLIKRPDKAFTALRKAIALEPYNEDAVGLLADLGFLEKRNDIAIGPLERLVGFEQKSEGNWARLARALLDSGQKRKAVDALKRQASVRESSAVFNNLGVAHHRLGERQKAMQYFRHAISLAPKDNVDATLLPVRNLICVLCEENEYLAARTTALKVIEGDPKWLLSTNPVFSDIYAFYFAALVRTGERKEALRFSKRILKEVPNAAPGLRVWLAASLVAEYGMVPEKFEEALGFGMQEMGTLTHLERDDNRRHLLHNNLAFLLIEMGRIDEAQQHLSKMSRYIHVEPYATATLGLLNFKRGHIEKGQALYEEALRLAPFARDRRRIAQKMNLELGYAMLDRGDTSQARRCLMMAAKDNEPVPEIRDRAKERLMTLKKG